jgi:hypothetical protein
MDLPGGAHHRGLPTPPVGCSPVARARVAP